MERLPLAQIEAVFFDVGNTLITMDFAWVSRELGARGTHVSAETLRSAEPRVRPWLSRAVEKGAAGDVKSIYLDRLLCEAGMLDDRTRAALVAEVRPALWQHGEAWRLWSEVMPDVRESLERLRAAGYRLVVVSNADGTVEHSLERLGLRAYFDAVMDSHVVRSEKPDAAIFEAALAASGIAPERTLHVGDMHGADVIGACGVGIHAVLLDPADAWTEVECAKAPNVSAVTRALLGAR